MELSGKIYVITNQVNGKRYVGKTTRFVHKRWGFHISGRNSKATGNTVLSRAIKKYGVDAFRVDEVATISAATKQELTSQLNYLEREYIVLYQSHHSTGHGYNLTWGGDGGPTKEIVIDASRLKQMVLNNNCVEDIAKHFVCSTKAIYTRFLTYFGFTIKEFKKRNGVETHYNHGARNPMAISVDVDRVRTLLEQGITSQEICLELKVSHQKLYRFIKENFGGHSYQVRAKWGLEIPQGLRAAHIPKIQLESLIRKGCKKTNIAKQFNVTVKAIDTRVHRYWGSSFSKLKKVWSQGGVHAG